VEDGEVVLGFVGYYRPWHRLDVVLDALRTSELARARLVLIGEGPAREPLERRSRENGVERRVHFAGARRHAEIPRLLPAFDVALLPAINPYASPLKIFEYMAASLAIVAPDQPNLREVLASGEEALLVPAGDAGAMAAALGRLAADPALRARLGARARQRLERSDLTWTANARRVIAALGGER
jgi:glycosyltransferase involved in cell wall biosynthesis